MQTVLQYGADLKRKITHPVTVHEGAAAGREYHWSRLLDNLIKIPSLIGVQLVLEEKFAELLVQALTCDL